MQKMEQFCFISNQYEQFQCLHIANNIIDAQLL
jgi:hypothetical protein